MDDHGNRVVKKSWIVERIIVANQKVTGKGQDVLTLWHS